MLSVVIQAGGQSRRMGRDKALVQFMGEPLIQRGLNRLRPIADEMLVTTNKPGDYEFLGVPLVEDLVPGRGALGGLYTALEAASHPLVAVVACDMPFLNPTLLIAQRAILQTTASDAVIPDNGKGLEPFHALYRRATCLPAVRTAIEQNHWRVDAWFGRVKLYYLSPAMVTQYDPEMLSFFNINTPEDLAEAERIAEALNE
jgi:molybdopterin-guanine dinucleotide biosynthesis protein A